MPYVRDQYASAEDFGITTDPNIIEPNDALRCGAYDLYDDFYHNRPETFRVTLRSDSDTEIYLPSTKMIVNSTARFLAANWDFVIKGGDQAAVDLMLRSTFTREEFNRKHIRGKKSYLTRGDQVYFITADPNKLEGQRVSINSIHPRNVFAIEDINDPAKLLGYHIVDLVHDPKDKDNDLSKQVARRQTYRKEIGATTNLISYEVQLFEIGAWDDRVLTPDKLKKVGTLVPLYTLPPTITALPVYVIPNNEPDGSTWGTSLIAGIEHIINALNQSITYEDLTVVLQGLGLYVTTAGPPVDGNNQPTKYKLHPSNVVEIGFDETFERVDGVTTVQPFQDHMACLRQWAMDGTGLPDMAAGQIVDVAVAQSGIALALKMGPIIAENSDRQETIRGRLDQMGYDLINGWLPAFESLSSPESLYTTIFGDAMPVDRDAVVTELVTLFTANLITIDEVRKKLEPFGYEYSTTIVQELLDETTKKAQANNPDPNTGELGQSNSQDNVDTGTVKQ